MNSMTGLTIVVTSITSFIAAFIVAGGVEWLGRKFKRKRRDDMAERRKEIIRMVKETVAVLVVHEHSGYLFFLFEDITGQKYDWISASPNKYEDVIERLEGGRIWKPASGKLLVALRNHIAQVSDPDLREGYEPFLAKVEEYFK
jgi:hypothetical protein